MTPPNEPSSKTLNPRTWLSEWDPEDPKFWEEKGKAIATRTLIITTLSLVMAFSVWFVVSAIIVKLDKTGFASFTKTELFWLAAMPGLAAGTFRIIHMFLTPKFGTRHVVSISTATLLIPLVGWYFAVQNPDTPYSVLLLLAFLAGLGGGNFSSFMPSTSLFYPKSKQGTALGVQAGIGNFGVSLVQFLTPWVIGFALIGSAQVTKTGSMWLQNAVLIWIPFVAIFSLIAWFGLKSVPVTANTREQMDIFREKHTWTMTSLYVMTFGSFAGLAALFPILIKTQFGDFPDAPDPLKYAFIGPLVGSMMRVITGPISDKIGGAKLTQLSGIGMLASAVGVCFFVAPSSKEDFTPFVLCMVGIFFFAGIGNASTFKQIPMLFDPRKAAGVIGWTAAIAAYAPFFFGLLVSWANSSSGSPKPFFYGMVVFYLLNILLNWWYFARKGASNPC